MRLLALFTGLVGLCLIAASCSDDKGTGPDPEPEPILTWQRTIGGTGTQLAKAVMPVEHNGCLVLGSSGSATSRYMMAVEYDSLGDTVWTHLYGDGSYYNGDAIIATSDGGYVFAGIKSQNPQTFADMYVVKVDSVGTVQWETPITGTMSDVAHDIIETSNGFVLAGWTSSFGGWGTSAATLVFLNSEGIVTAQRLYGGGNGDEFYAIAEASNGDLIAVGTSSSGGEGYDDIYVVRTDYDGNTLWVRWFGGSGNDMGYDVVAMDDGTFIVGGATGSFGAIDYDGFLLQIDGDGDTLWTERVSHVGYDYIHTVSRAHDGGCVFAGQYGLSGVGAVAYMGHVADGNLGWIEQHGVNNEDAWDVAPTADGGYMMVGYTYNYGSDDSDMLILKTNDVGQIDEVLGSSLSNR